MYYYQIYVKKRKGTYTYLSKEKLNIGTYCKINFANKILIGLVIRESNSNDIGNFKIKEIDEILYDIPKVPNNIIKIVNFINNYYITDYYSSFQLIGPYENMSLKRMEKIDIEQEIPKNDAILNEKQEKIYNEILNSKDKFYLLHGITGSGKTQIYIKLIEQALNLDKSSIFLVPEISLTTQMVKSIKKVFGDNVSVIHSKMTVNKKAIEWEKIYSGKTKLVIGARSAIFAPVSNLGYIIIDEEHENSYKQEDNARYHVRTVAFKRAILEDAKVILGSATPSFETYYNTENGKIRLLELNQRYNNAKLPKVEIIDLEKEESILSKKLLQEISNTLIKNEQVILLLNRKSYSLLIKCHDCKQKHKCKNCSSNMKYFKKQNLLKCLHCNYQTFMIKKCSFCQSEKLEFLGIGIEKIEEKLNEYFGEENILRVDSSSISSVKELENKLNKFKKLEYKIMIGTQIIAKGFHFPNVTLVGIINLEQGLQIPDFRQGEKTFQLVIQASGRAGREEKEGKVLIQSYDIHSNLIKCIEKNDYKLYYNLEMKIRKMLSLPPYKKMIKIIISSKNEQKANKVSKEIYQKLVKNFKNVSDVSKAMIYKLSNEYRNNIYIKTDNDEIKLKKNVLFEVKDLSLSTVRVLVDVDPITT